MHAEISLNFLLSFYGLVVSYVYNGVSVQGDTVLSGYLPHNKLINITPFFEKVKLFFQRF